MHQKLPAIVSYIILREAVKCFPFHYGGKPSKKFLEIMSRLSENFEAKTNIAAKFLSVD